MIAPNGKLPCARAQAVAEGYKGLRALSVEELLAAADVDLVLNLTIPSAHADIALKVRGAAGSTPPTADPRAAATTQTAISALSMPAPA